MKKTAPKTSKSLKTFYLYTCIVLTVIVIALASKVFFTIAQSKVDTSHNFTFAITQQQKVKEIVSFHPQTPSVTVLVIQDKNIPYDTLARDYGISTDGYIQVDSTTRPSSDMTAFLWSALSHAAVWQSNLTAFDKIRLLLLAKSVAQNNRIVEHISLIHQSANSNTILANALADQDIANENVSIQIINATTISGFGLRLSRVLTNMGANVIDVSTAQNTQTKTTITYYGNDSYTLERLQKLLHVQATKMSRQSIADIVITLGKDKSNTKVF